jgi:pre-mRNA-splicing factor RBM22/SLT11
MLDRLKKTTPYYRRNLPHLCSFFAKGSCNRGKLCPYRHEMPVDGPLAHQNIKDRYFGQNDPVAQKMLGKFKDKAGSLEPPEDRSITTLWVGHMDPSHTEQQLRAKFSPHGELASIRVIQGKGCAFVTFKRRTECEKAASALHGNLDLDGINLRLAWGKKQSKAPPGVGGGRRGGPPGSFKSGPPPGEGLASGNYPSMDPSNMAARLPQ